MKYFEFTSPLFTDPIKDCYFKEGRYASTDNTAIDIHSLSEGPIMRVTYNDGSVRHFDEDIVLIKDWSENEGIVEFLASLDVLEDRIFSLIVSECSGKLYRLNRKEFNKYKI